MNEQIPASTKTQIHDDIAEELNQMDIETTPNMRGYAMVTSNDMTIDVTPLPDGSVTVSLGFWSDDNEDTREFAWKTWDAEDIATGADVPYEAACWVRDGLRWMGEMA